MPDDWFSPTLQFAGAIIWPIALLITVVIFRKQLGRFIDEISEVTGFGANAKRSGVLISEDLKNRSQERVEDEPDTTESEDRLSNDVSNDASHKSSSELLQFVGRQIESNLKWAQQNCSAASSAVCAEIVRSTYTDLRLGIRAIGYHFGGTRAVTARTLRHVPPHQALERVGAPIDLIDLVTEARNFSIQVRRHEIKVNEQATRNFIESLIDINQSLFHWAEEEKRDGGPGPSD
jgi:hypothetical protein